MLLALKNVTLSLLGRIPFINRFVPEKYKQNSQIQNLDRTELEDMHKNTELGDFTIPISAKNESSTETSNIKQISTPTSSEGKRRFREILEHSNLSIIEGLPTLINDINNSIQRTNLDPKGRIQFQEESIANKASNTLNALIANYHNKFPLIEKANAADLRPEERMEIYEQYVELMQGYINQALEFIVELNNRIIYRTATLDSSINNQHIAEAFQKARDISSAIATKAWNALYASFKQLPQESLETREGPIHITQYISQRLKNELSTLYTASNFGIHSIDLINAFKDEVQQEALTGLNSSSHTNIHNALATIETLHEAMHGSILWNGSSNASLALAQLDPELINRIRQTLVTTIVKEFNMRHDDIPDSAQKTLSRSLVNTKKDLADCLSKIAKQEVKTMTLMEEASQSKTLKNLGLTVEQERIKEEYQKLNSCKDLLGRTNNEHIMGQLYHGKPIVDELTIKGNSDRIDFERLIYETSLLALMDVIAQNRGTARSYSIDESTANFKTVPWLKSFYEERCTEYKSWIESTQVTELPTRQLAKELARLGSELHELSNESHPWFSFSDFCNRYKIKDLGDAMLERISDLTNTGVLALQLELFSLLFTYLRPGEQKGLTDEDVKKINDMTEFILEQSILKDEKGKQVIAPKAPNSLGVNKYIEMLSLVGNRGSLIVNTKPVLKFLLNSLGIENGKTKLLSEQSTETKNSMLAALLFYVLIKHLPERSNSIDSLLKRQEIFTTLVDNYKTLTQELPVLQPKVVKQSLGLTESGAPHPFREGVIVSICQDLERHLKEYPVNAKLFQETEQQRKQLDDEFHQTHDAHLSPEIDRLRIQERKLRPITLANLLTVYEKIHDCINRNPETIKNIESTLSKVKQFKAPILKDIREYVANLIDVEPETIINFVKSSANKELQSFTKKLLISQAAKAAQELAASNTNKHGIIEISDNDEVAIRKYSKILNLVKYTAFLVSHYGAKEVSINSSGISNEDQRLRSEIINRINAVSELLRKNVLLLVDDSRINEEVFIGQLEAKRELVELLEEFKIKSAIDHKVAWTSLKKAQRIINEQGLDGREQRIIFPARATTAPRRIATTITNPA